MSTSFLLRDLARNSVPKTEAARKTQTQLSGLSCRRVRQKNYAEESLELVGKSRQQQAGVTREHRLISVQLQNTSASPMFTPIDTATHV